MALNTENTDAISFKKLSGKAHTQQNFAVSEEGISSNIQISYTTVFGNEIDGLPETNGLVSEYNNDGVVERVKFEVDIVPDTEILVGRSQGYRLKLPADYNANGYLFPTFSAGTYLHQTLGKLQIVPSLYGTLKSDGSTEYDAKVYQTDGSTQITKFDSINWYLDTYNGILFVQDPPAGYNVSAARPGFVEAFLYVGRYVNDALGNSDSYWRSSGTTNVSSGVTISGATVKFSNSLEYMSNISSGFTKHSIVDVNYVTGLTSQITSGFTQAGNGITVNGSVVSLGGGLSGDTVFTDTRATKKGLEYGDNYSLDFVKHSLVDVNFVTGITSQLAASSGLTLATNGLTKVDGFVKLGGTPLSETTSIDGNSQAFSLTDASKIVLTARNTSTSESVGININATGFTITDTRTGETGIKYGGDYSSGFTKYSLVDVNYVTGITGTFTADNGLTKNGINVSLGGVLDNESTVIEGTGDNSGAGYRELYLGSSSGPLGYLEINTDSGTTFNDLMGGGFHVETYQNGAIDFKAFGGSGVVLESKLNGDNTSNKAELNVHYNGLYARNTSNVTTGVTSSLYVSREVFAGSGGPVAGFGVKLNFDLTNSLRNVPNAEAGIAYVWNDPTDGSEDGRYDITVHANSIEKKILEIDKNSVKYPSNFSSGFTKHSLVDVNYVTGITSNLGGGSITGSSNGLTTVGKNIVFGGSLTGATLLDTDNHSLIFDYGTAFETGNTPIVRATVGGTEDVAHLSFRHNSARTLSDGFTDIKLGTNVGNPNSAAGGNIAIGQNVLTSLETSGSFLSSPWYSTFRGDRNIAIGFDIANDWTGMTAGNQGTSNILMGVRAGKNAKPFSFSIVMGWETANNITADPDHWETMIAIGTYAMSQSTINSSASPSHSSIMAIGSYAGYQANFIDGFGSTLLGESAGYNAALLEDYEILIGGAGQGASLGRGNIGIGERALWEAKGGSAGSTGLGTNQFNVAVGVHAMEGSGPSEKGTYVGCEAGQGVVIGNKNSGFGSWSLPKIQGHHNTGIGAYGGYMTSTITGNGNTFIGPSTGVALSTLNVSNVMVIGNPYGTSATTGYRPAAQSNTVYVGSVGNIVLTQDYDGSPKTVTFNSSGLTYGGDYSSNFTKHSIVDVNYVTGLTSTLGSGSITGASNGLTAVGSTIIFGGTLTGDTTVDNDTNTLTFIGQTSFNIQNVAAASRFDFLTTSLGATNDISLLSFRTNSGRTVTDGYSDVWLGLNNGNSSSNAGGNIGIGSNNLQAITPTGAFFGDPWYQSFQGDRNIAIGYNNGKSLTGGAGNAASGNILVGTRVMELTTQSSYNIFMGFHTARNFKIPLSGSNGQSNIGIGNYVMQEVTGGTASDNVFFGASVASTTKRINSSNVGIGNFSYQNVTNIGHSNIAVGANVYNSAGNLGDHNTGVGSHAFRETVSGMSQNTAVGVEAGVFGGGFSNSYLGAFAGFAVRGQYNTSIGALSGWVTGNDIVADTIGAPYTGNRSLFIGYQVGYDNSTPSISDVVVIGNDYRPVLEAGNTYIGGIRDIKFVTDTNGDLNNVLTLTSGGTATFGGITNYDNDKSSGFTKHSLVDVNYVTGITSTIGGLSAPTDTDQERNVTGTTSGDGSNTGLAITNTPKGFIFIMVNGVKVSLGNAVKTKRCYFSNDGGTTARAYANITAGDTFYWNGTIAGYELTTSDIIDFYYA